MTGITPEQLIKAVKEGNVDDVRVGLGSKKSLSDQALDNLLDEIAFHTDCTKAGLMLGFILNSASLRKRLSQKPEIAANALYHSVQQDNLPVLSALLNAGIPPDTISDEIRATPLYCALRLDRFDAYNFLRDAGADLTALRNLDGKQESPFTTLWKHTLPANFTEWLNEDMKKHLPQFVRMLRDFFAAGFSPQSEDAQTFFQNILLQSQNDEALYLAREGVKLADLLSIPDLPEDIQQFITRIERQFFNLFQLFAAGNNPYTGAKSPQPLTIVQLKGEPPPAAYLSDHPLALLHAFSAIGKLEEAMQLKHWRGIDGEKIRLETMDQLYPHERIEISRTITSAMAQASGSKRMPCANWQARITQEAPLRFEGR